MKKPIIALTALVLAAGGSVGALIAVKNKKNEDDKKEAQIIEEKNLFSFDSESIIKAVFNCPEGDFTAEKNDGIWSLTSGGSFELDQTYLQLVCTYLSDLTASDAYELKDSSLSSYGLDSADKVTLSDGTNDYSVNVGNISPTGEAYYISLDDRDKVYTVSSYYGSVLKTSIPMLKSKLFLPYSDNGIVEISVKAGGKTAYELKYDTAASEWKLPAEYADIAFDLTSVRSLIANLTRLTADLQNMCATGTENLPAYGLDKPTHSAVFKGIDGSERNYIFNYSYDVNNKLVSAYCTESDQIMLFPESTMEFLTRTPYNFIVKSVTNVSITQSTGFEFTVEDTKHSFTLDMENKTGTVDGTEFDFTIAGKYVLLSNLFNAMAIENIKAIDISSKPELSEPLLTAVFHVSEGDDFTYQLTDAGNEFCYVFINGKYTGELVSKELIKGKNSVPYFYDEFMAAVNK